MFQALHFSNHIAAGCTSPKSEDQTMILDTKYHLTFNAIIALFSEPEMPLWWANMHHVPWALIAGYVSAVLLKKRSI